MSLSDIIDSIESNKDRLKSVINKQLGDIPENKRIYQKELEEKQKKQSLLPSYFKNWLDKIPKSDKVLDLGCGFGFSTKFLLDSGKFQAVVGVDDDPIMIKKAKELYNYEHFYYDSSYTKLTFKDNNFDAIFSYDSLRNQKNIAQTLGEVRRILKNNGTLILIVLLYSVVKDLHLYSWMPQTKEEIISVVEKSGFKIEESEQINTLEKLGLMLTQSNNTVVYIKAIKK